MTAVTTITACPPLPFPPSPIPSPSSSLPLSHSLPLPRQNCASISDFYKSLRHYRRAALALTSSESVLQRKGLDTLLAPQTESQSQSQSEDKKEDKKEDEASPRAASSATSESVDYELRELQRAALDMHAELHKRWVELDLSIMKVR